MNMEGMKFGRAVFYDPVFDSSLPGNDVWDAGFGIEHLWRLAVYGEIKLGRARGIVGIYELFGEKQAFASALEQHCPAKAAVAAEAVRTPPKVERRVERKARPHLSKPQP